MVSFYNESGVSQPIDLENLVGQLQNNYTSPLFNLRNFPKDQSEIDKAVLNIRYEETGNKQLVLSDGNIV